MLKPTLQPTLLVFTLGAAREQRRRHLLPDALREQERALHQRLLDSVLDAGRECGCRLLVSSPEAPTLPADARLVPQAPGAFGERLAKAFADASAGGRGPVLLVGTDVPGLTARHLRQALSALDGDAGRVVVGPSPDGGLYLLACHRLPPALLRRVPWCRRSTRASLLRELRRSGRRTLLLEPLADLDRRQDLDRWLSSLAPKQARWRAFAQRLLATLARSAGPLAELSPVPVLERALPVFAGRAPPR